MRRRQWFDWHSWVGLQLSLLMAFVVFTGTLATLSPELDWLSNPAKRATSVAAAGEIRWATMLANFEREFPDARASRISVPAERFIAPELVAVDQNGERFRVYFDRAGGAVQGTGRWFNWQRFLREAHRHLMLPLEIGLTVVALMSVPLLITFWSSFYVYKHWWRGFFRLPRRGQSVGAAADAPGVKPRRRFWGDLHRLAGVWSLWFVLLMAVTGLWYLAEHFGLGATLPELEQSPTTAGGDAVRLLEREPVTLDGMIARAAAEYPDLEVRTVLLDAYGGAVVLQGQATAVLVRQRANHVAFDGFSGALLDVRQGESLDLHNRVSEAADPLHFGDFGGPLTRYLWALFGVFMTLLSLTGVYLFGLRSAATLKHFATRARSVWRTAMVLIPKRYILPQGVLVALCLALAGSRLLLG